MITTIAEPGIPWGDIAGGSAVGAVLLSIFLFLKDRNEQRKTDEINRKESHETIRKAHETVICVADKFAQTVGENTDVFGRTIKDALEQAHEAHEKTTIRNEIARQKCEDTIATLLRDGPRLHTREKGPIDS